MKYRTLILNILIILFCLNIGFGSTLDKPESNIYAYVEILGDGKPHISQFTMDWIIFGLFERYPNLCARRIKIKKIIGSKKLGVATMTNTGEYPGSDIPPLSYEIKEGEEAITLMSGYCEFFTVGRTILMKIEDVDWHKKIYAKYNLIGGATYPGMENEYGEQFTKEEFKKRLDEKPTIKKWNRLTAIQEDPKFGWYFLTTNPKLKADLLAFIEEKTDYNKGTFFNKNTKPYKVKEWEEYRSHFSKLKKRRYFKSYKDWVYFKDVEDIGECASGEMIEFRSERNKTTALLFTTNSMLYDCKWDSRSDMPFEKNKKLEEVTFSVPYRLDFGQMMLEFIKKKGYKPVISSPSKTLIAPKIKSNENGNNLILSRQGEKTVKVPIFRSYKDQWKRNCFVDVLEHFPLEKKDYIFLNVPINDCAYAGESGCTETCDYGPELIEITSAPLGKQLNNCLMLNHPVPEKKVKDMKAFFNVDSLIVKTNQYKRKKPQLLFKTKVKSKVNAIQQNNIPQLGIKNLSINEYNSMHCNYWLILPN